MRTPKRHIPRVRLSIGDEDIAEMLRLMEDSLRGVQLTMGPLVEQFERLFAEAIGVRHAVAVSSGTAALELTLRAIGIQDREVIVPTETFVASANSVLLAGGRPVFAEIRPATLCLDIADVARRITPRAAGVMMVHMAGLIQPDLEELRQLCRDRNLFLIEDAAHAHGAAINGEKAGALGRAGCFSFYPTKLITTGEGGMITTNDDELAATARSLRNHGANPNGGDYVRVGANWRLPELAAAVGLVQLKRLDDLVAKRNQIARWYGDALADVEGLQSLTAPPFVRHTYWNYIVMLDENIDRDKLASTLRADFGIETAWPYDPPCHLQPVFRDVLGCRLGDLPQSEQALARHLALPMYVQLTEDEVGYVAESLKQAFKPLNTGGKR